MANPGEQPCGLELQCAAVQPIKTAPREDGHIPGCGAVIGEFSHGDAVIALNGAVFCAEPDPQRTCCCIGAMGEFLGEAKGGKAGATKSRIHT